MEPSITDERERFFQELAVEADSEWTEVQRLAPLFRDVSSVCDLEGLDGDRTEHYCTALYGGDRHPLLIFPLVFLLKKQITRYIEYCGIGEMAEDAIYEFVSEVIDDYLSVSTSANTGYAETQKRTCEKIITRITRKLKARARSYNKHSSKKFSNYVQAMQAIQKTGENNPFKEIDNRMLVKKIREKMTDRYYHILLVRAGVEKSHREEFVSDDMRNYYERKSIEEAHEIVVSLDPDYDPDR